MKKALVGTLLGALVYFVWGAASWILLPWHTATIKKLPNETLLLDTMRTVVKEPGLYCFPADMGDRAAWSEKMRQGPVGLIAFSPAGRSPMDAGNFVKGFLADVALAALLMWVLWASRLRKRIQQIHLAAAIGLIAGLAVNVPYWNFMDFPAGFTLVSVLDLLVGFALAGAVMGAFVPETSRE